MLLLYINKNICEVRISKGEIALRGGGMPQTYTTQGKELLLELYKSLQ